jgi:hypothetical protein
MYPLHPDVLATARLPSEPGLYWAKKSPMADWVPTTVKCPIGSEALVAFDATSMSRWYPVYKFYEWGPLVADSPEDRPYDLNPRVSWEVRKQQRRALKDPNLSPIERDDRGRGFFWENSWAKQRGPFDNTTLAWCACIEYMEKELGIPVPEAMQAVLRYLR